MLIIETEIWKPNPDRQGTVIFDSQRKARDIFVELKEHLKADGRLPDEYFLFDDMNWGKGALFPKDAYIYCVTNYGESEGIYLDIYLKYEKDVYEYNKETESGEYKKRMVTENFATGKTLGHTLEDMDKMNLVASSVTAAFNGNVQEFIERYARVASGEEARLYPPRRDDDNMWEGKLPVKYITAEDILNKLEKSFGLPPDIAKDGDFELHNSIEKDKVYPENAEIEIFEAYPKDKERGISIAFHIHYLDDYGKEYREWFGSGITDKDNIINTTLANDFLKEKDEDITPENKEDRVAENPIEEWYPEPESTTSNEVDNIIDSMTGIAAGNVANLGLATIRNEWIYYCNFNQVDGGNLYVVKADGTGRQKLSDDSAMFINVAGDRIYYSNVNDDGKLYTMKTDGSDKKRLNDDTSIYINVVGNNIYYRKNDGDDYYSIYTIKIAGTGRHKLIDDRPAGANINVAKNRIYYRDGFLSGKIYTVKADGSDKQKLSDDEVRDFIVAGDRIYYISGFSREIYTMNINGTSRKKLNDDESWSINVAGNRIYYTGNDTRELYSMSTDGTDKQKLNDEWTDTINVVGDWIFYTTKNSHEMYIMKTDGSERQLVD